jgi:hypothetical protein
VCSDTCATLTQEFQWCNTCTRVRGVYLCSHCPTGQKEEISSPLTAWREQGLNEVNLKKLYSDDENDLQYLQQSNSCSTSDKIGRQRGMRDVVQ